MNKSDGIYRPVNRWLALGRRVRQDEMRSPILQGALRVYSFWQTEPVKVSAYSGMTTMQLIEAERTNKRICTELDEQRSCSINPLIEDQYRMFRMFLLAIESELNTRMIDVSVQSIPETAINVPVEVASAY